MSHSIYLYQSNVTLFILIVYRVSNFSQCLQSSSYSPFFNAIPQHIIISPTQCTGYTALFETLQSLQVRCPTMSWWSTDTQASHWASWLFQLEAKHGPLSRTTHCKSALGGLWTVYSPWHLTSAVVKSSPRYDHNVCVHLTTSNCCFYFRCSVSLKCMQYQQSPGLLFCSTSLPTKSSQIHQSPNLQVCIRQSFF